MYLKRLEMYGFKSFADKTILEFMPGITTVIGPNGSGKSNISDCIRWVLGEQSIKSLRGGKAEDIIFAGTQNRKALGFAEASLIFDNQDQKLPIEYNEVIITRRLYRTGETGYFINKTPCRLKDVLELFMDTGIGKDGYSIIGQGKIDEILSNKSEDRRHIFEEAAGIVKYRVRKQESEKKLEQVKLNLLRINDIITEIEANIEPLKNQSEKAKKYLALRDELKSIEISLFLYNINSFKSQKEELSKNLEEIQSHKALEEELYNKKLVEKEDLRQKVEELITKIEEMQNLGVEGNQRKEKLNSEITIYKEKILNNNDNFNRYSEEITEIETRINELNEEKKQKESKKDNLYQNKAKFEKELEEKEKELSEYTKTLNSKELEIEYKKKIVQDNVDKKYEIIASTNIDKANVENLIKNAKSLKNEIDSTISELDLTRTRREDSSKGFYVLESSRNDILKNLDSLKSQNDESNQKIKEFEDEINSLESTYRIKESRLKFLQETEREKEGYQKSVKLLMNAIEKDASLARGVHGVLASLISVDKKYETAIEMCLGASLQNIVTKSEDEAKKLVEFLRSNNLGRASFLPITSVKGQKISGVNSKGIDGIIGIASDLISCDRIYNDIILSLLGRTIVVDDINNAIELAKKNSYKFKIVTLKGDIINPSGAISGGSVAQKTVSILGRGKEIESLEKELLEIKQKIEKIKSKKVEYENSISEYLERYEAKKQEFHNMEITYATEKQKVDTLNIEIEKLESKLAKLREDLKNNQDEQSASSSHQNELLEEVRKLDEENEKINEVISEFQEANKENQKYIDDLNFDVTNLKISVSSFDESELSIKEMVDRINQDIDNNKKSIINKENLKLEITKENEEISLKIDEDTKKIEELEHEILNSNDNLKLLKDERLEKSEKLSKVEELLIDEQEKIDIINNQASKIEIKVSKIDLELEQVINKMWDEYELTPNNVEGIEEAKNPHEVSRKVSQIRNDIKELGSINIDAIAEYKETKDRYDFMCEQRLDLENSSNNLKKIITEMTDTMKVQFEKQFNVINKNFSEVFKELFGGGMAELILTDKDNILECGIDINVQPPGKKLQNMMLLSGGERAFTAIAILFAILKVNPAPFCVLDEIEAALDDVNVYRYADYLKKFAKDTQFLVITHRKGTMEAADTVYGITMEEKGISKLLSMKMK